MTQPRLHLRSMLGHTLKAVMLYNQAYVWTLTPYKEAPVGFHVTTQT